MNVYKLAKILLLLSLSIFVLGILSYAAKKIFDPYKDYPFIIYTDERDYNLYFDEIAKKNSLKPEPTIFDRQRKGIYGDDEIYAYDVHGVKFLIKNNSDELIETSPAKAHIYFTKNHSSYATVIPTNLNDRNGHLSAEKNGKRTDYSLEQIATEFIPNGKWVTSEPYYK